ncbi:MAG: FG-GAP-like repeat-containing protein [Nitrospirota bacterium]
MKKVMMAVLLVATLLNSSAFADKALGPEEFTSIDELAYAIAAYFPKVQGGVTAVQGDRLTVALGEKNGIMPGMALTLWRDGREILHPVTKAVIGRAEDEVGTIEVVSVKDTTSIATMKKQLKAPQAGDRARITPKKIGIGILPLRNDRPEIIQNLAGRLAELGRFTVLGNDKVDTFLKDKKQRDAGLIKDMGRAFGLDAVVAVGLFPSEGKYVVTGRIFYTDDAKPLDTIVALLNLTTKREALGEVRPFFAPVKTSGEKAPDFPVEARYFAIADLDGDNAAEYVVSDEKKLSIYRSEPSGWKEVWSETVPGNEMGMQQFHIDVADINGNGRPEIFVTRMLNSTVSSYVIEFQDGSFKRTAEVPGFLRVIGYPGRGNVLIGQDYSRESFFDGKPREYAWSGGAYAPGAAMDLPKGTDLYSFIYADFGEPRPLLVSFDKDHRLVVYTGETPLWRSEERYLTVETVLTKPLSGLDATMGREPTALDKSFQTSASYVDKSRLVRISGRIIAVDLYGSGKDDLVVAKNTAATFLGGYKGGELEVLTWTGTRLEPRWNVKDLAGPVLDIQVSRPEKTGVQINGLVKVSGSLFGKDVVRVEKYQGK